MIMDCFSEEFALLAPRDRQEVGSHRVEQDPLELSQAFTVAIDYPSTLCGSTSHTGDHSHSIVPGGLLVTSYTTRLIPFTSFTMRLEIIFSTSCGRGTQSAVMPSSECTARMAQVSAYVRMSPITPTDITGSSTANDCHTLLYSPARLISVTTMSSASCSSATRSGVTSPRMRTANPGPGKGCRCSNSSGIFR